MDPKHVMDLMAVDPQQCPCGRNLNWRKTGRKPWLYMFTVYCSEDCAMMAAAADA